MRVCFPLFFFSLLSESTPLSIWDCSGSERYRATLQQLYSGSDDSSAHGAVLMYDMTDERSFEELQYWYNEIMRYDVNQRTECNGWGVRPRAQWQSAMIRLRHSLFRQLTVGHL